MIAGLVIDTNALSAFAEGAPGATQQVSRAGQVAIPVIVLGEYRFGIAQSRHKREYERWLEEMLSISRVLDVNEETANWYARLRVQLKEAGTPIPSNDAWIAAALLVSLEAGRVVVAARYPLPDGLPCPP